MHVLQVIYTVRNANGNILQFLYGEDGFDGAKIEKQKLLIMGKSDKELYEEYMLTSMTVFINTIFQKLQKISLEIAKALLLN